jgi:hypothetical protein
MTPTMTTTAGAADPQCVACGIEVACAYHAAGGDTESAMREASATVGRVREADTPRDDAARESGRDIAADLGIPADELDRTPSVETLRAKSHALAGRERELAHATVARRDLARDFDLEPATSRSRVREASRPEPRERSIEKDLGLRDDELIPVPQLREASARRSAPVDRWRQLEHLPVTEATARELRDSLRELGELGELGRLVA